MKRNLEMVLLLGMGIVILCIGIIISLSWNDTENLNQETREVLYHKDMITQTGKIVALIIDNETAVRGFALIGDEKFAKEAKVAETSVHNEFKTLKILAAKDSIQKNNLDSLNKYINKKTEFSNNIIGYRRIGGQTAALKYILTGDGIAYTKKVREIVSNICNSESNLLAQHSIEFARLDKSRERYYYTIIIFVAILMLVLLFAFRNQFKVQKIIKKELEKEVLVKTEELNHIFERITDGFFALDNDWRLTYVNKKAGDLVKADPKKIVGENIWEEFPKFLNFPFRNLFYKAKEDQRYVNFEEYYEPFKKWFDVHVYPSMEGLSIFFSDITKKKDAEIALQESEKKFHNFFENTPVGIIIRGIDGELIEFNDTICKMLGYSREELTKKPWTEVSHPDDIPLTNHWIQMLRDGKCNSARFEKRFFHKNGDTLWFDFSIFINLNAEGKPNFFIASVLDITDRKKLDGELKESEEKYRSLVQQAADGIFLHDTQRQVY